MSETPDAEVQSDRPRPPRTLIDLPHELIIKVIIEVILEDRTTGRDQVRANSGAYALSRTNAYWQAEVESQYRKLYIATSLFPGFAIWSLQSDWLFRRDAFSPDNRPLLASTSSSGVDGVTTPRPRTQASSVSPKSSRAPTLCSCSGSSDPFDSGASDPFDTESDGWPDSDHDSETSMAYAPKSPRPQAVDSTPSSNRDVPKATGKATFDNVSQLSSMTAAERNQHEMSVILTRKTST